MTPDAHHHPSKAEAVDSARREERQRAVAILRQMQMRDIITRQLVDEAIRQILGGGKP